MNGKLSKLAFGELIVVELAFGVLVCLCVSLTPTLIACQSLVFLLRRKEGRKKKKKGIKEGERTTSPKVKLTDF